MTPEEFERVAAEEYARVPERFRALIKNVALIIENEPDEETRKEEGLTEEETLLGLYRGVPATARGDFYSGVLPDTITLYREPILDEAKEAAMDAREVIRETMWHEIAHYFGMEEDAVDWREEEGTNRFKP